MNASHDNNTVPAENWDDDFVFNNSGTSSRTVPPHDRNESDIQPRISASSSNFTEDWDNDQRTTAVLEDKTNDVFHPHPLHDWAEQGPSSLQQTPTKRTMITQDNWDDDFEDSPARQQQQQQQRKSRVIPQPPENDIDDFKSPNSSPKRTREDAYLESSDEEAAEFTAGEKDEDRTLTARSRRKPAPKLFSSPPPIPDLPTSLMGGSGAEPFPRSPTASVFSVPGSTAGRNSVTTYVSTSSHVPLRGGPLAMLPPSPPTHRERRRLRKKSRPPHVYDNVFELAEDIHYPRPSSPPSPPRTPERETSMSPLPPTSSEPPVVPASPPTKGPLLSRIGSVKRWGVRRKRTSTTPSELIDANNETTPRPASSSSNFSHHASPSPPNKNGTGWFFRVTGGDPGPPLTITPPESSKLKRETSIDQMKLVEEPDLPSPTKLTKRKPSRLFDLLGADEGVHHDEHVERETAREHKPSLLSAIRRPSSLQPGGRSIRHFSDGSASIGRSASNTLVAPSVEDLGLGLGSGNWKEDGGKRFLGGVRRISLGGVKKHKRNKSATINDAQDPPAEVVPIPPTLSVTCEVEVKTQPPIVDELLPPIELRPPSPPRSPTTTNDIPPSLSAPVTLSSSPPTSREDTFSALKRTPISRSPAKPKSPGSPQSASLGRTTAGPIINLAGTNASVLGVSNGNTGASAAVPRRNSLGDLKIPARISQAQVSLRRDLGLVRDFAASVEQLKDLQTTYFKLVEEIQAVLDALPPARATSPTFFHIPRPHSRARANTNPIPLHQSHKQVTTTLYTINSKYKISWECAELLIELGGGTPASAPGSGSSAGAMSPPPTSVSAPVMQNVQDHSGEGRKSRERAITLAGDDTKHPTAPVLPPTADPPNLAWRASTGRHDLSQRQLIILREMLNSPDGTLRIPEEAVVNRAWRWGDAMSSTVTLPSEESVSVQNSNSSPTKKRRSSKMGMTGLREMLKALKRTHPEPAPPLPSVSDASASTESSIGDSRSQHYYPHPQILTQRRRVKTSIGPESIKSTRNQNQALSTSHSSLTHKSSPRRPSLASIFRLGQRSRTTLSGPDVSMDSISNVPNAGKLSDQSSTTEEEDWDCMDSASDLEHAAQALESADGMLTVKGKKGRSPYLQELQEQTQQPGRRPITPKTGPAASRSSIFGGGGNGSSAQHTRSTRLSNVEENVDDYRGSKATRKGKKRASLPVPSPSRQRSRRGLKSDSVRSAPPQSFAKHDPQSISEFKLAMTPENIKPLLENAREVHLRLNECIAELKVLLAATRP